jgi:hypothetical protein
MHYNKAGQVQLLASDIQQIKLLYQQLGNIRRVADQMGIPWRTVTRHLKEVPKQKKTYHSDARTQRVDRRTRIQVGEYWRWKHGIETWLVVIHQGEQVLVQSGSRQHWVQLQEGKRPVEWALDWRWMKKELKTDKRGR